MNLVKITLQGTLLRAKVRSVRTTQFNVTRRRGRVNVFSRRSRKNLLSLFNTIDFSNSKAIFLTLTYPKQYPDPQRAKQHLRAFLKRLDRLSSTMGKNVGYVWRLEFQKRGAPHFHIIAIDLPFIDKKQIKQLWCEVIGVDNVFTRIEFIRKRRKLLSYVSKYVAKNDNERRYVPCGFNTVPYPATREEGVELSETDEVSMGRFWGIENRANIVFAEIISWCIGFRLDILDTLRFVCKFQYDGITKSYFKGFAIFCGDDIDWLNVVKTTIRHGGSKLFAN
jgi:hypothetical protein